MFQVLNKSAIWLLWFVVPITGAVLQPTYPSNPPTRPPAMGGPGYAVGRSVV